MKKIVIERIDISREKYCDLGQNKYAKHFLEREKEKKNEVE